MDLAHSRLKLESLAELSSTDPNSLCSHIQRVPKPALAMFEMT